jgi:hypothetical protein
MAINAACHERCQLTERCHTIDDSAPLILNFWWPDVGACDIGGSLSENSTILGCLVTSQIPAVVNSIPPQSRRNSEGEPPRRTNCMATVTTVCTGAYLIAKVDQ